MRFFHRAMEFETKSFARPAAQALLLVAMAVAARGARAPGARAQDGGRPNDALFNKGAEIVVTVHDVSGEAISSTVMVAIYKDGARPAGQTVTSRGSATFVVTSLGEFSVVVEAAGYRRAVKEVSVPEPQRTSVDVYLQREAATATTVGVPGRPVLTPKAKEAFEQGLLALGADKMGNAEKYVSEAVRLAPGHPDVLYVQGVLYLKQRKFGQAQTALESATQIDPTHARAFAALGMALSDQAKYSAAIVSLEKSLQIDPAVGWDAQWALAKAYYQQGRYEEALKLSQAAAELAKGKQPQIALLVAQSLTATGKYEEAAVTLRGFVKEHGERDEAVTARRWLQKLETSGKIASPRQEAMKQ
jgi:Flp pilus assembly protein TadD